MFITASAQAYQSFDELKLKLDTLDKPSDKLSFLLENRSSSDNFNASDMGTFYYRLGFWQIENGLFDDALSSLNIAIDIKRQNLLDSSYIDALLERSYVLYINSNDADLYCPDRSLAVELARELGEPEILAKSLSQHAFCFQDQEGFLEAIALLNEALQVSKEASLPAAGLSVIHNATGLVYQKNYMYDKAYEHVYKAWQIWDSEGDVYDAFNMLHNLVDYASSLKDFELANQHVQQMYQMSEENPVHLDFVFFAAFNDGLVSYRQADYQAAVTGFKKAVENEDKTNEVYFTNHARLLLSEALIENKQYDEASEVIATLEPTGFNREINKIRMAALLDFANREYRNISKHLLALDKIWSKRLVAFIEQQRVIQLSTYEAEITSYENQLLAQKLAISELELAQESAKNRITTLSILLVLAFLSFLLVVIYQLTQSKKSFKSKSETDFLTGIANRGFMMEEGERMLRRTVVKSKPFSVILFDLDDFKTINDTYGHDVGDTVLKTVSKITQQLLRENDLFGRVGGEEFLILLPSTDKLSAIEIANRLRTEVAKTDIVVASASLKSSISLGVSSYHTQQTLSQLISKADKALYEAKRSGKNKAVSS